MIYIMIFLVFCIYIWNYLKRNGNKRLKQIPRTGTKEYYRKKYLYHSKMSDKHAKEAQRAFRKYINKSRNKGQWR